MSQTHKKHTHTHIKTAGIITDCYRAQVLFIRKNKTFLSPLNMPRDYRRRALVYTPKG